MPFTQVDVKKKVKERMANDPEFKEAYLEARREYKLINRAVEIREKLTYSQNYVAKKIGVKQQVISRIETIGNSPTLDNFIKYADALGLEVKFEKKLQMLKDNYLRKKSMVLYLLMRIYKHLISNY